ncbi:MAG: hypothetical protein QME59_05565 [Candidatus Hydrothermarchaeota archaeon]|nr:hypothetical protein [Candidatus Hydrothermarchaeota archaeon]
MNVLVEIFFPSGACHCTTKVFREQVERIVAAMHAKRARELGIYEANTAEDLRKKITEVVSGGK